VLEITQSGSTIIIKVGKEGEEVLSGNNSCEGVIRYGGRAKTMTLVK
jgi:hypothetical protein